ncbi:EI24 domain-containing protein [Diaphorobacter aerolatus]|uniref:EI24 domain-containing protein n=1 Tax=Diaphorobacter aerolatus TaxID=1288495 RepID=A0A7H0GQP9_9BURK|nr:EI24 domain-containing protein [Diaphorobacter aerolatus]QNP50615.1 EI24 domain-containing protein [Diaphorobacter aerolatus]
MSSLFDSFWRAAAYCLIPRVIVLSLLPLLLIAIIAGACTYFFWDSSVAAVQQMLGDSGLLSGLWNWLANMGWNHVTDYLAPLLVVLAAVPVIVLIALLSVAAFMTPALVNLVAARRFPHLVRKHGGSLLASVTWSALSTVAAMLALVVSSPLWLIPPLVLVLPPLIWGWLTYRVMSFDALSEHASKEERKEIFARHRYSLLGIGVVCGFLGAAPSLVWASAVVFAAAFLVLIPIAIWIYTLVFAFSSLWFTHYCLAALEQLRLERNEPALDVPVTPVPLPESTATVPSSAPPALSDESGAKPGNH